MRHANRRKCSGRSILGLAVSVGIFSSCGQRTLRLVEVPGNGQVVLDASKSVASEDITFQRLRVWKSAAGDSAPGALPLLDRYVAEVWFTLAGESKPRYSRFGGEGGLLMDDAGNLYSAAYPPGRFIPNSEILSTSYSGYTIAAADALLAAATPIWAEEGIVPVVEGGVTISKRVVRNLSALPESPFGEHKRFQFLWTIAARNGHLDNSEGARKGKLGCLIRGVDASGNTLADEYLWEDVELGTRIVHKNGVLRTGGAAAPAEVSDTDAADDALLAEIAESWHISGVNLKTKTVRVMKRTTSGFFTARELPLVDRSDGAPRVSGFERLILKCNEKLATLPAPDTARYEIVGANGPTGSDGDSCSSLKGKSDSDRHSLQNWDYKHQPASGNERNCDFPGASGSWGGSRHGTANIDGADGAPYSYTSAAADVRF